MDKLLQFSGFYLVSGSPGNTSAENRYIRGPQAAQSLTYVAQDFARRQLYAFAWHHKDRYLFRSIFFKTDRGTVSNRVHSREAAVHIFKINFLAAPNDHVFCSTGNIDV